MAGLFYLPRLYAYHADALHNNKPQELADTFIIMERRLLRIIMNPAMILSFVFGIALIAIIGLNAGGWLHAKILLVLLMAGFHGYLAVQRKKFAAGQGDKIKSAKFYKLINEIPTILMIAVVVLVVIKPF